MPDVGGDFKHSDSGIKITLQIRRRPVHLQCVYYMPNIGAFQKSHRLKTRLSVCVKQDVSSAGSEKNGNVTMQPKLAQIRVHNILPTRH